MLQHKFKRFYSHILASLSAIGIVSIASEREAAAGYEIGGGGETVTFNYYDDIPLTATYTEQLECQTSSSKNVIDAFPSGSNCVFICKRGYGVANIGQGSNINVTGSCAFYTTSSDTSSFKSCIQNQRSVFYNGSSEDYGSVIANQSVQNRMNGIPHYWYSGTSATPQYDCIPLPNTVTFDCGEGEINTNSYTGAIRALHGESFTLPSANACHAPEGYTFNAWES